MNTQPLEDLKSDSFIESVAFVATAPALHRLLRRAAQVRRTREALNSGALSEKQIRTFVSTLMNDFRHGEAFEHDLALAALAVALERRETPFAEEFLGDLARLETTEMSMSIRVARECLKARLGLAGNKKSTMQIGEPEPTSLLSYEELGRRYSHQGIAQARKVIHCGAD
jgi:hypothetical protein